MHAFSLWNIGSSYGQFNHFFNSINYEYRGVFVTGEMGGVTLVKK